MRPAPSGPRTRQPTHPSTSSSSSSSARPAGRSAGGSSRPPADRDQVFASIFGRQATGHHAQAQPQAQQPGRNAGYDPYASNPVPLPPSQAGSGYEQFAPPLPPGMTPAFQRPPPTTGYPTSNHPGSGGTGYSAGEVDYGRMRERRGSQTPSVAPSLTPSLPPHGFSSARQPGNVNVNAYHSAQGEQVSRTSTAYQPSPYPQSMGERNRTVSSQSQPSRLDPSPPPPRTAQPFNQYGYQTLPLRNNQGLTPAQSYRMQESLGAGGTANSSPGSVYVERSDSRDGAGYFGKIQPLNVRPRPGSGATNSGRSGVEAGTREEERTFDREGDSMSPPPDYSTMDPALHPGQRLNSTGPPRLPELIGDVKGLRLFDQVNNTNLNESGDWSFLTSGFSSSTDPAAAANTPTRRESGGILPGKPSALEERMNAMTSLTGRNVSGASTVRAGDYRPDGVDPEARARVGRESVSTIQGSPTSTNGSMRGSYEDELRDRVHPVVRHDPYSRHRRQASDASIVSVSTVHSGYGTGPRNSQTYLPNIDTTNRQYGERGSPVMSSPATLSGADPFQQNPHRLSGRPSNDSIRSMTYGQRGSYGSATDIRSTSFSGPSMQREAAVTAIRTGSLGHGTRMRTQMPLSTISQPSPSNSTTNVSMHAKRPSYHQSVRRTPTIHPAFLSKVAEVFRQGITLGDRIKDGLSYSDAFDGREAVELLCDIVRTSDRNLALLLGRSLDSRRFFHDVTYAHKLRDNSNEVYRFKQLLPTPFNGPDGSLNDGRPDSRPSSKGYSSGSITAMTSISSVSNSPVTSAAATPATSTTTVNQLDQRVRRLSDASTEDSLPIGVFVLLTDCYSPTCSRDTLCYSISCPRRTEQQKRLNLKVDPGLTTEIVEEGLGEVKETGTLWIQSVPQDIIDSVDDTEKKRQEAINELIYTERDFVRDMEYLRDQWIKPLRTTDVVPIAKREELVQQVFWNTHEILAVNSVLAEKLTKRQKQAHVVARIGDILLEQVQRFEPFVTYGAHQLFGKYEFEKEKGNNPAFQKFVDDTERDPASRKLELNGYLTKPTTRLARYPLLLEVILKFTPEGHQDKEDLVEAVKIVREFLSRVNTESGKSENLFNLAQLDQQLIFRPGENFDLHLRDKNRELVYKGPLKCRGGPNAENADLLVFLFDHALLMVKPKWVNKHEQYKVYRKPIPLELLVVTSPEDVNIKGSISRGKATVNRQASSKSGKDIIPKPESKHGYSLTLVHLGRKGYTMTLWAPTYAGRKKWLENIDARQQALKDRSKIFETVSITDRFFVGLNKLNCAVPYDRGNRMIYGTDDGVYFSNQRDERLRHPTKVLSMADVTQVDVLEEFQLLVVLSERSVTAFPLEALDPTDTYAALKRGKRLSSHTSFFKSGICLGRTLLCIVKSSSLSSTIKTLEPVDQSMRGKKQPTPFRKLLNNSNEPFKVFKEFYIPTESNGLLFLKTRLCVATTRGFEVVDLETLDTQGLLDPSDSSLDFVAKRENVRPVAIYRVEENFLLCYAEFAFYVNKTGWRARPRWAIQWEGFPTAFAIHYPFILAFEPTFIEVRHVESGNLVQIVTGNNIRCLFSDTPPSHTHAANQYRPGMAGPYGTYGPGSGSAGHANPHGYPYAQNPPPPTNPLHRSQIIFVSDEGNVQLVRLNREVQALGGGPNGGSISRR